MSQQVKKERQGFEVLQKQVVLENICTHCSACSITCPFPGVLDYEFNGPLLAGECRQCGICLQVCPRYKINVNELEEKIFGRVRTPNDESYGISRNVFAARSTASEILKKGQDGGVVTALLTHALSEGRIDGAAVSSVDTKTPWFPQPALAITDQDIIRSAGTRYTYSPNLLAFKTGIDKKLKKIAFVGTPCQIRAIRRIQSSPLKKYSTAITFTIGLFCSESFSYQGLMIDKVQDRLGIKLNSIVKINIKGGMILYQDNGTQTKIPLKDVKPFVEAKCHYCDDFSAELADISVGGVGLDGWTLTIPRTEIGETLLNECIEKSLLEVKPVNEIDSAFKLMKRLAIRKRKRARPISEPQ